MSLPIHQIMDVAPAGRCWTVSDTSCPRCCRRALGEAALSGRCWTVSDSSCPRRCRRALGEVAPAGSCWTVSDSSCPRPCRRALGEAALSGRQHTRTEGFSGHSTQAACKASHHITRWQRLGAAQRARQRLGAAQRTSHAMNRKHNQYTNNNTTNHVTIAM